ncbi:hypothetical protein [Halpernia sp.]|uniref:hypothetical protein n=1 Tax=Halpernia sp. TaxID=2782209 RepID=UPI003A8F7D85
MKKLLFLVVLFLCATPVCAANYNLGIPPLKSSADLNFVEVYNLHEIGTTEKTIIEKGENGNNLIFKIGFNLSNRISYIYVSNNISNSKLEIMKRNARSLKTYLACTKSNQCSDKPTNFGVVGCYAECAAHELAISEE